jgi:hypothetical protein
LPVLLLVVLLSSLLFATPAAAAALIIFSSPSPLPTGQIGVIYSASLYVIGGTGNHTWSVIGLPPGLTFTPASAPATTGVIAGTPTTVGTYNSIVVTVTDSSAPTPLTTTQVFSITIAAEPITFYYDYLAEAKEGVSYEEEIYVEGGKSPYTFSLASGSLPTGLSLDSSDGIISGTPDEDTAGTYHITIGVTDSSTPHIYAQKSYSLVVEKGFYESVIKVSSTLAAGETDVYVNTIPVTTLAGGETTSLTFEVDEEPVISVELLVNHPTKGDVRYRADEEEITVTENSPNATFNYTPEYYVDLKTDPSQIATLTGTNWYVEGSSLMVTAEAKVEVEGEAGTEYRFAYWLLPTGEKVEDEDLSWRVSEAGKVIATYDTYYELTMTSPYGTVDGSGWYKAGTEANWSVSPTEVSMSGLLGILQGKLKPENANGTKVMNDAPETIALAWKGDYTMPIVFIVLLVVVLGVVAFFVYRRFNPPVPRPAVTAPVPASPTIVFLEGGQKASSQTTREQLLEQFGHLLQKYEDDVRGTKTAALPESKFVPEAKRLSAAKVEALVCGYTSKKLLRTVVGNWHKQEERIVPPPEEAAEKKVTIVTLWTRDIYNEWEVFTCSLHQGHSGSHHGTTSKAYSLQSTATEEKSYTARQKIAPPKSHFTDNLPIVDVAPSQVISSESTEDSDQVITPDEVIPPDED